MLPTPSQLEGTLPSSPTSGFTDPRTEVRERPTDPAAATPPPLSRGSRARSTCRQARARPRPWAPGSRRSARPPASGQPRAAASGSYSTLHFAEGADAQRVAQHVVSDLHPPVVLLLLSHLRRAQPRSATGSSERVRPPPPRALQCGRRLPTVQRARGGAGRGRPEAPRGARRAQREGGGVGASGRKWRPRRL